MLLEGFIVVAFGGGADTEGLAGFVLERGGAHELADAHVHVEQQVHFGYLGHVALHEDSGLFGVDAGGEVFGKDLLHGGVELHGVGVGGEGVEVGYEEIAVVVVLHPHKVAQGAEVVAQVEVAGGADAAKHYIFFHLCQF